MSYRTLVMESVRAEMLRRAADRQQEIADGLRHWNPFPRTVSQKQDVAVKREAWATAEAEVRATRQREHASAWRAANELLRENKRTNRRES